MNVRVGITAIAFATIGIAAWSHGGATGIVKERMDGMSAMSRVVKNLTPMMRGKIDYDESQVQAAADVMIVHAGDQMTRLFPQGTGEKPSAALPAVWEDWEEFAALAEELQLNAQGLKIAASNGLAGSPDGMSTGSMMGSETESMMGETMMGLTQPITSEMFENMPANLAFDAVAQTCSACHQKFRAKEN